MRSLRAPIMRLSLLSAAALLASCGSSLPDVTGLGGGNTLTATYSVTPIGTQYGDSAHFNSLNDIGEMTGHVWSGGSVENVLFKRGGLVNIESCDPVAVNNSGLVLCSDGSTWTTVERVPLVAPSGNLLPTGLAINDAGQVAGELVTQSGTAPSCGPDCTFLYFGAGDTAIVAGRVGPTGATLSGPPVPRLNIATGLASVSTQRTFGPVVQLWSDRGVSQTLTCSGINADARFLALGGQNELVGQAGGLAFTCKNNVVYDIGPGVANDISRAGLVVGQNQSLGFVFDGTSFQYLDDATTTPGYTILSGDRVNDAGQILAMAKNTVTGQVLQVLLTAN